MEKIIQKIKSNPYVSILFAILLGWGVILISKIVATPLAHLIGNEISLNFYTQNVIFKFILLLFSIATILLINKGKLKNYGFALPESFKFIKTTLITIGIIVASIIVGYIIFILILGHLFPTTNHTGFPEAQSLFQLFLTAWVWSSICEEVWVRGLVQSFIQHINFKIFRLSIPVIISGLLFGSMHLMLFSAGMGVWNVCALVLFATATGILAAYFREKTKSLIPAIWIHFVANVVGYLPLIIMAIINLLK